MKQQLRRAPIKKPELVHAKNLLATNKSRTATFSPYLADMPWVRIGIHPSA